MPEANLSDDHFKLEDTQTVGMPRVVFAIRVGLLVLFVAGVLSVALTDAHANPWVFGTGVVVACIAGVLGLRTHNVAETDTSGLGGYDGQ